jgi:exonuclease III
MAKFLKLATWNANGLIQHRDELKMFLYTNDIDVMLISETHFTEKSYIRIPQYTLYHTNHPAGTAWAGTATSL